MRLGAHCKRNVGEARHPGLTEDSAQIHAEATGRSATGRRALVNVLEEPCEGDSVVCPFCGGHGNLPTVIGTNARKNVQIELNRDRCHAGVWSCKLQQSLSRQESSIHESDHSPTISRIPAPAHRKDPRADRQRLGIRLAPYRAQKRLARLSHATDHRSAHHSG